MKPEVVVVVRESEQSKLNKELELQIRKLQIQEQITAKVQAEKDQVEMELEKERANREMLQNKVIADAKFEKEAAAIRSIALQDKDDDMDEISLAGKKEKTATAAEIHQQKT